MKSLITHSGTFRAAAELNLFPRQLFGMFNIVVDLDCPPDRIFVAGPLNTLVINLEEKDGNRSD